MNAKNLRKSRRKTLLMYRSLRYSSVLVWRHHPPPVAVVQSNLLTFVSRYFQGEPDTM